MTIFVYSRQPIDYWYGWMTEHQYLTALLKDWTPDDPIPFISYVERRSEGMKIAAQIGWEGDVRGDVMVAGLPSADIGDDGDILIAWKQDNNGQTFIVSPVHLPWLEQDPHQEWWPR